LSRYKSAAAVNSTAGTAAYLRHYRQQQRKLARIVKEHERSLKKLLGTKAKPSKSKTQRRARKALVRNARSR
jgi:hypothetical protein